MKKSGLFILTISLLLFFVACSKSDDEPTSDNSKPTASFTIAPASGTLATVFAFDASASSDPYQSSEELRVRWDWENDGNWDTPYSLIKTENYQYQSAGNFTVKLEVINNEGLKNTKEKSLSVSGSGELVLQTGTASEITTTSAKISGNIVSVGDKEILQHGHCWSVLSEPSVNNSKTELGATAVTGTFVSNLSGLFENMTYFVRAYATTSEDTVYATEITIVSLLSENGTPCPGSETVTDAEGNVYETVMIDGKCWMKENLKIGTMINSSADQANNALIEKYCYNNKEEYCEAFGGLYQWDELMQYATSGSGICPDGWRPPTFNELKALESTFGSSFDLLAQGSDGSATNASGFTVYPAGYKSYLPNEFAGMTTDAKLWSNETYSLSNTQAYLMGMINNGTIEFPIKNKKSAYSVRCIKEN
jgi:uncharacterized protein (TIGR02145 family)